MTGCRQLTRLVIHLTPCPPMTGRRRRTRVVIHLTPCGVGSHTRELSTAMTAQQGFASRRVCCSRRLTQSLGIPVLGGLVGEVATTTPECSAPPGDEDPTFQYVAREILPLGCSISVGLTSRLGRSAPQGNATRGVACSQWPIKSWV